jgi:hypothetical protein
MITSWNMSAAAAPSRQINVVRTQAQALVIGSPSVKVSLQNLFACSNWKLAHEVTLNRGIERLTQERFPAVICGAADWKPILDEVSELERPPVVIALSQDCAKDDWMRAIASHVYVLDANHLTAPELFSLLNHAWRLCNRPGL